MALTVAVAALVSIPKVTNADVALNQHIPYAAVLPNARPPGNPLSLERRNHVATSFHDYANGQHYDLSVNTDSVEAVDTGTGTVYSYHLSGQYCPACSADLTFAKFNGSFTGPQFELTGVVSEGLESHGSQPNLLLTQKAHVTIHANGDLTADVPFESNLSCQGP